LIAEPYFAGRACDGPNEKLAKAYKCKADFYTLLAGFHSLERKEQLVFAAMYREMITDRSNDT